MKTNTTIQKFGHPDNLIKEYNCWVVLLRPEQVTAGSCVIVSKSEDTDLGSVSTEAWAEFGKVCKETEDLLRKSLGAEKFNYLALMMSDPHVHFHFIPRYSRPVTVGKVSIEDVDWPHKTELKATPIGGDTLAEIKRILKSNI